MTRATSGRCVWDRGRMPCIGSIGFMGFIGSIGFIGSHRLTMMKMAIFAVRPVLE